MKRTLLRKEALSRIWIALGVLLLVASGVLALTTWLEPGSAAPAPRQPPATATASPSPSPEPSPTPAPIVASVNGYTITDSYLEAATALNAVLSELAGQESLGSEETLQRLIKQEIVLQGTSLDNEITEENVEDYIGRMQQAWNIDEQTMMSELVEAGVERAFLEDTIHRLLAVQAAVELVESGGQSISEWLAQHEQEADIRIHQDMYDSPVTPEKPQVSPTDQAESSPSMPAAQPESPDVAPDFTLSRAGGGSFTLEEQLKEGPVVLVFFEKCG
jgi:hypothetical protein